MKGKSIAVWVVCVLLALEYAFAGIPKLIGNEQAVAGFRQVGYSDGFRLFIGACEAAGAVGLLVPRLRFWAAAGLMLIMVGALATLIRMHDTLAHAAPAAISLVLLALIAWATAPRRERA